jgi:hypothetical protein
MPDFLVRPENAAFLSAVRAIAAGLQELPFPWAITGSLGFALQGSEAIVNDIDLQTSQEGAFEIERRFTPESRRKVAFSQADRIRSYFGAIEIAGLKVEIMGALQKRMPDGSWEDPVDVSAHRVWVEMVGLKLPVMDLQYEYLAYRILGRIEKAQVLREWLDAHPLPPTG